MNGLKIEENNHKEVEKNIGAEMDKAIKHFERELATIRTGRAHTSLVDSLVILPYEGGAPMPLKSIASIAAPEARLITIQPWDASVIPAIERAIAASDLGVKPISEAGLVRIQLPEMSSGRRDELVKVLHKKLEECRIAIRNIRKDCNNLVRDAQRAKKISENAQERFETLIQKSTDDFIKKAEETSAKKEKDIKTV